MSTMIASVLLAVFLLNLLLGVRLVNAADEIRQAVLAILRMQIIWGSTWPDETVRTRLLAVISTLSMTQSLPPTDSPSPTVMGFDGGIGAIIMAIKEKLR